MTKVTRVNMIEFNSEAELEEQQEWYQQNGAKLFPDSILQMGVQTGPTSIMSVSVYPDQSTADEAMATRDKLFKDAANTMSGWSMEGPVRHWTMPTLMTIIGEQNL